MNSMVVDVAQHCTRTNPGNIARFNVTVLRVQWEYVLATVQIVGTLGTVGTVGL